MTDYENPTDDGFWRFWWPRALRGDESWPVRREEAL